MGSYRYYLWIGAWSTHASLRDDTKRRDALASVTIIADGEPLSFEIGSWTHDGVGVSTAIYDKPVATAIDAYYPVTLDQVRLLAEAGYPDGFDLAFANTALPGTPYMVQIGVAVADFWQKIGVNVKMTNYEWGAFRLLYRGEQKKLAGGASMFRTAG